MALLNAVNKSANFLAHYCNRRVPWSDSTWSDSRAPVHCFSRPNIRYHSLRNSSVLDPSFGRWGCIRLYHSIHERIRLNYSICDIVGYLPPRSGSFFELVVLIEVCNSLTFGSVVRIQITFKVMSGGGTYDIRTWRVL